LNIQKSKAGRPRGSGRSEKTRGEYTPQNIERFWAKVNKNGPVPENRPDLGRCWIWMGGGNGKGYGQVRINYSQRGTHQVAWELVNGKVPQGLWVLHQCDNRNCCNPAHLFLGTTQDNMTNNVRPFSTGTVRHHLTKSEVLLLKALHRNGATQAALAEDFDVAYRTVSNIVNERTRKPKK
jgi:hypothetical protein